MYGAGVIVVAVVELAGAPGAPRLSFYISIYLSNYLSIYLSIYQFTVYGAGVLVVAVVGLAGAPGAPGAHHAVLSAWLTASKCRL